MDPSTGAFLFLLSLISLIQVMSYLFLHEDDQDGFNLILFIIPGYLIVFIVKGIYSDLIKKDKPRSR